MEVAFSGKECYDRETHLIIYISGADRGGGYSSVVAPCFNSVAHLLVTPVPCSHRCPCRVQSTAEAPTWGGYPGTKQRAGKEVGDLPLPQLTRAEEVPGHLCHSTGACWELLHGVLGLVTLAVGRSLLPIFIPGFPQHCNCGEWIC